MECVHIQRISMPAVQCVRVVLLGVQAGGRGQPMHAKISGDDPAYMPDCGA
jgi:hypothetical protein